jgi:hypothetical protein
VAFHKLQAKEREDLDELTEELAALIRLKEKKAIKQAIDSELIAYT